MSGPDAPNAHSAPTLCFYGFPFYVAPMTAILGCWVGRELTPRRLSFLGSGVLGAVSCQAAIVAPYVNPRWAVPGAGSHIVSIDKVKQLALCMS